MKTNVTVHTQRQPSLASPITVSSSLTHGPAGVPRSAQFRRPWALLCPTWAQLVWRLVLGLGRCVWTPLFSHNFFKGHNGLLTLPPGLAMQRAPRTKPAPCRCQQGHGEQPLPASHTAHTLRHPLLHHRAPARLPPWSSCLAQQNPTVTIQLLARHPFSDSDSPARKEKPQHLWSI